LLGGRLTSTVAPYRLTKDNILSTDPTNPLARVPIGEARSRGIELDLSGQLTDHWRIGRSRLTARLNINNLMDQRYFESSNITDPLVRIPHLGITPGAPLTVLGSIQVTY
jgi:outer membrane receptor protein involved in Fe transport